MTPWAGVSIAAIGVAFASTGSATAQVQPSPESINEIGHAMVEAAGTSDARILLYAEVSGSNLLFETRYVADGDGTVRRAAPSDNTLLESIANAWRHAHSQMGNDAWRVLIYRLDHGRVNVRVLYSRDFDSNISFDDRYAAELGWLSGSN